MIPSGPPTWLVNPDTSTALSPVVEVTGRGRDGLLVSLSDLHIGGDRGQEDFYCHTEFVALLDDLDREPGPVTLLINGDLFEFLQVTVPPDALRVQAIVESEAHAALFACWREWNTRPGHRTVYLVGNHDAETGWNAAIGAYLIGRGYVHEIALGYEHRFTASVPGDANDAGDAETPAPAFTLYAEHGNEDDEQNAIGDYGHPLVTPLGSYVVTQFVNRVEPLGRFAGPEYATTLSDVDNIHPSEMIPWWLLSSLFYRQVRRFAKWVLLPAAVLLAATRFFNAAVLWLTFNVVEDLSFERLLRYYGFVILDVVVVLGLVLFVLWWDFMRWRRRIGVLEPVQIIAATREHYHAACRAYLNGTRRPAHRQGGHAPIDVFLFGHNHTAEVCAHDAGGRPTIIGNSGTWVRKITRLRTHLKMPPVFIPRYDLTYLTAHLTPDGLEVALKRRVKPLRYHLGWPEQFATLGNRPPPERLADAGIVQTVGVERISLPAPVPVPAPAPAPTREFAVPADG